MSIDYSHTNILYELQSFVKDLVKICSNCNAMYMWNTFVGGGGVNIFEIVDAYYLGNYDIHSLYIIYGKKSTKFNPNMPLRKLTVHENGYQK